METNILHVWDTYHPSTDTVSLYVRPECPWPPGVIGDRIHGYIPVNGDKGPANIKALEAAGYELYWPVR